MNKNEALTEHELYKITITGLLRSVELLEDFVLNCIDSSSLSTEQDRSFLNRVKKRKNTSENPMGVYLRPEDVS